MKLIENKLRPRDIVTRKSLRMLLQLAATRSTNAGLHLPAIANECDSLIWMMWLKY